MFINYNNKDNFDKMITILTILTCNHQLSNIEIILSTLKIKTNSVFNNSHNSHYIKIIICKIFVLCLTQIINKI